MSQLNKLFKLAGGCGCSQGHLFSGGSGMSNDNSEISLPSFQSDPELNRLLKAIQAQTISGVSTGNSTSSENTNSGANSEPKNVNVQKVADVVNRLSTITSQYANRIVSVIRFLASPLRLYIKAEANFKAFPDRIEYVKHIAVCDDVKNDLVGNWSSDDTYGLMMLVKMMRFKQNIYPSITSHQEYMACFKPRSKEANQCPNKDALVTIAYYLSNIAINTPYDTPIKRMYNESLLKLAQQVDEKAEYAEGILPDLEEDFRSKIATELNMSVENLLINATVKFSNGQDPITLKKDELSKKIYDLFAQNPSTSVMSNNMNWWLTTDDACATRGGKKGKGKGKGIIKKKK
jgi:hypothetical protein